MTGRRILSERDHAVWKGCDDFMLALCECLDGWGLDMMTDDNIHDLYDLWNAGRRAPASEGEQK
ncbi:Uncharacterised protein [Burkholderia pseudomallei]|nr:Uncharacterised protein [Burkholderia pseudomallei]CAJ5042806.1 Uncharacterised protein [Burkholderia pseudomallei]VBP49826.1 Uncharacterised protein [Burkholderia pseudomallei]